jgi:hypothetical protein
MCHGASKAAHTFSLDRGKSHYQNELLGVTLRCLSLAGFTCVSELVTKPAAKARARSKCSFSWRYKRGVPQQTFGTLSRALQLKCQLSASSYSRIRPKYLVELCSKGGQRVLLPRPSTGPGRSLLAGQGHDRQNTTAFKTHAEYSTLV